ncbi:hypothetical protein LCGC14_3048420 [marine sediment metagenome]|uniref:Uncharacterized protein n=1 Tax=marine sediment metagenome TaxID=412755 RepID=A0A0F8ZDD4_9ZZZZ
MARVTVDQVNDIVDTKRDCTPFIETANLMVTEDLVGKGLTDARLVKIELYLSAHLVVLTEERGGLTRTRTGDATDGYAAPTRMGTGLELTRYGQMVMQLDTTGTLKASNKLKARFTVM